MNVATIAFDEPDEQDAAQPPLSLHPAFPGIVALWFAALLGIGSLVLPAVLLERAVAASGIGSVIAAANPPLGLTARGLIALAAALVGAGLGLAVARRVARAHTPELPSRVAKLAAGQRRPISVHDELGGSIELGAVVNGEALPLNRRRALAISEDERPSDFLYQIPLPGADADAPTPVFEALPDSEDEALELVELAAEETDEDFEMTESRETAWPTHQHFPAGDSGPVDEMDLRRNLAGPRGLEPLPFAAPSLARRASAQVEFEPEAVPEPEVEPEPQVRLEAVTPAAEEPEFRADWETAPLDGLGLVQLVQRLGSTIERRRERMAQVVAAPAVSPPVPASFAPPDLEPAPAEEAVQAMAAFFAPAAEAVEPEPAPEDEPAPAAPPPFLRSLQVADDEDEDEDDAVPDFSLPLRRQAAAPAAFAPAEHEDADDEDSTAGEGEGEGGYSSLLGLSNPFAAPKSEFVRIDEPVEEAAPAEPAVVFPGQHDFARPAPAAAGRPFDAPGNNPAPAASAPRAPADADAALRAALATLQRMSGAA